MICEICGKKTERAIKIIVDGATLNVCPSCAKYGNIVSKEEPAPESKKEKIKVELTDEEVIEDFHKILRKVREERGKTQEEMAKLLGLKFSLYKKLEDGELKPSIDVAKKIEKILKIKITKTVSMFEDSKEEKFSLTVADVIKFED